MQVGHVNWRPFGEDLAAGSACCSNATPSSGNQTVCGIAAPVDRSMPETQTKIREPLSAATDARSRAPVFVVGSARSGTTLLYHMLLSSGNFAVYRTESNAINLLEPAFGNLSRARNKRELLRAWYNSRLYTLSGLDRADLEPAVMADCHNGGDFLRIVMEAICRKQGVQRWADTTPEHLLCLPRIKQTIPNALVIHVIRDGRDVALSSEKLGYIRPLPWDRTRPVMAAGLHWEWIVNRGRKDGQALGHDYLEVRFEELVGQPREILATVSQFIEQDLDYDRIRKAGIGTVRTPNTSFPDITAPEEFDPVGRWRTGFSPDELACFESLVGTTLRELGYEPASALEPESKGELRRMRGLYRMWFDTKRFLKGKTPLGRWLISRDLSWI
jgi:hypothetical protein